jgi:hypothetical protein
MNLVNCSRGGTLTFTENVHMPMRACASVAVQLTGVVPGLKKDPDAGAHATLTGCAPPTAVGTV